MEARPEPYVEAVPQTAPRRPSGGVREVLRVALPLILAASSHALRLFTDRVMLSRVSPDDLSASLSAGIMWFTLACFFIGLGHYAGTFVAQYIGAKRPERVGVSVWQGVWLALIGWVLMATGILWAPWLFDRVGHDISVRDEQVGYFRILCGGAFAPLMMAALCSFWSGRGKTWTVAGLEGFGVLINIVANLALIYGWWGFPRLGIVGAGIGTIFGSVCALVVAVVLFLHRSNRERFRTWPQRKFDGELLRRLVWYGLPSGLSFFLDIASVNLFVILVGQTSAMARVASTVAFSMNAIAFIPMVGIGMTATILVGQAIGAGEIPHAKRAVRSARVLILAYMAVMSVLFLGFPQHLELLFPLTNAENPEATLQMAAYFLRYIAAYLLFDGIFILYNGALKGAGDTHFAMWVGVAISWFCFALPCLIAQQWLGASVWTLWGMFVAYVVINAGVFYWRYRCGWWKSMRVIEG